MTRASLALAVAPEPVDKPLLTRVIVHEKTVQKVATNLQPLTNPSKEAAPAPTKEERVTLNDVALFKLQHSNLHPGVLAEVLRVCEELRRDYTHVEIVHRGRLVVHTTPNWKD